jgi:cystathionine beta-lyase/cystathionine gamma-synthase
VVTHATSLGGVDTLVIEPRYTSHAGMTSGERAALGIPDGFLRVSVGVEDAADLIADLGQALAHAAGA